MKVLVRSSLFVLLALSAACATGQAGTTTRTDPDRITRAEIEATTVQNAYDLVQRLRPRWFTIRGPRSVGMETRIVVYLNNSQLGGVEALRDLETGGIAELEYLDAAEATASLSGLGSEHVAGAIIVRTTAAR